MSKISDFEEDDRDEYLAGNGPIGLDPIRTRIYFVDVKVPNGQDGNQWEQVMITDDKEKAIEHAEKLTDQGREAIVYDDYDHEVWK